MELFNLGFFKLGKLRNEDQVRNRTLCIGVS